METFELNSRAELTGFVRTANLTKTTAASERVVDYLDGEPANPDCNQNQGARWAVLRASIFRTGDGRYRAFLKG